MSLLSRCTAWTCTCPCACTWPSRFPGMCQCVSKSPLDITFPSFSLYAFWFAYYLLCYLQPQAAMTLSNCRWLFLTNAPGKKAFLLGECQVRLNKKAMWVESSMKPLHRANTDSSSGNGALKELQPSSAPFSGCQTAGFHHDWRLLVAKATTELGSGRWEKDQFKMPHSFLFLPRLLHFSWINTHQIAVSL